MCQNCQTIAKLFTDYVSFITLKNKEINKSKRESENLFAADFFFFLG